MRNYEPVSRNSGAGSVREKGARNYEPLPYVLVFVWFVRYMLVIISFWRCSVSRTVCKKCTSYYESLHCGLMLDRFVRTVSVIKNLCTVLYSVLMVYEKCASKYERLPRVLVLIPFARSVVVIINLCRVFWCSYRL